MIVYRRVCGRAYVCAGVFQGEGRGRVSLHASTANVSQGEELPLS